MGRDGHLGQLPEASPVLSHLCRWCQWVQGQTVAPQFSSPTQTSTRGNLGWRNTKDRVDLRGPRVCLSSSGSSVIVGGVTLSEWENKGRELSCVSKRVLGRFGHVLVPMCREGQPCSGVTLDPLCPPSRASIPLSLHSRRRQHPLPHVSALSDFHLTNTRAELGSCTFAIPEDKKSGA